MVKEFVAAKNSTFLCQGGKCIGLLVEMQTVYWIEMKCRMVSVECENVKNNVIDQIGRVNRKLRILYSDGDDVS